MTPPPLPSVDKKRTSTIMTIPTLLHRGAAEPLGPFGGKSTLEARLLAIFRSCCTTDQVSACRPCLAPWPYNLMCLFSLVEGTHPPIPRGFMTTVPMKRQVKLDVGI